MRSMIDHLMSASSRSTILSENVYVLQFLANNLFNPLPHSCAIILLYQLPHGYSKMFLYREPHDYAFMRYENDHAVYLHDGFKTRPLSFIFGKPDTCYNNISRCTDIRSHGHSFPRDFWQGRTFVATLNDHPGHSWPHQMTTPDIRGHIKWPPRTFVLTSKFFNAN